MERLLAGSIGSVVVAASLLVLGLAVSIVGLALGGALATVGLGVAALVLVVVNAIPAIVGGYVGGTYPGRETDETSRPAA